MSFLRGQAGVTERETQGFEVPQKVAGTAKIGGNKANEGKKQDFFFFPFPSYFLFYFYFPRGDQARARNLIRRCQRKNSRKRRLGKTTRANAGRKKVMRKGDADWSGGGEAVPQTGCSTRDETTACRHQANQAKECGRFERRQVKLVSEG